MPDTMPTWAIIVGFLSAVGGLSGAAALVRVFMVARSEANQAEAYAKKAEVDALVLIVNEVQEENGRLRGLVKTLQCTVDKLMVTVRRYRDGINCLLRQLEERDIEPAWRPDDDDIGV